MGNVYLPSFPTTYGHGYEFQKLVIEIISIQDCAEKLLKE